MKIQKMHLNLTIIYFLISFINLNTTHRRQLYFFEIANAETKSLDNEDLIKYESSWDGNHPQAMSESWTWMGHLKEYDSVDGTLQFKNTGVAFIHYYSRNKSKMGSLTFKTSALTPTINNIGQSIAKQTQYSSLAKNFYMKVNQKKLGIEWHYNNKTDYITEETFDKVTDLNELDNKLLPLFPNLQRDPSFTPLKSKLIIEVGESSQFNLTLYSIWQPMAPTSDGRIRFLGVDGTYTFFHPMILAVGHWTQNGVRKKVSGMLTLDRQWSNEYFGKALLDTPLDVFKAYRALSYSHHWSGFHGYLPKSKSWIFVHLWNQFYRKSNEKDLDVPYSNMVWVKNGIFQESIGESKYNWQGENFVLDNSKVLLNYGEGRERYFPSQFSLSSPSQNSELFIKASPALQSMEQPIYLFEGFGIGEGTWQGEPITVQGRIESSRILFRDQDYQEIVQTIQNNVNKDPDQEILMNHLKILLNEEINCHNLFCYDRAKAEYRKKKDYLKFITNDMTLKISILKSKLTKKESKTDPTNTEILIYY